MHLKPKKRNDLRMAVGTPNSDRSTVWKVFSTGPELYVASRMMARSCKVSLHSSGYAQWATTNNRDSPTKLAAFSTSWRIAPSMESETLLVFRIIVPYSELHPIDESEDLRDVIFLPAPPEDSAFYFEVYLSAPMTSEEVSIQPPHDLVGAFKLTDHGCAIVLWRYEVMSEIDKGQLLRLKDIMRADPTNLSLSPSHEWRGAGFVPQEASGVASFIECAPWSNKTMQATCEDARA
jgi:hypothetical protein